MSGRHGFEELVEGFTPERRRRVRGKPNLRRKCRCASCVRPWRSPSRTWRTACR